MKAPIAALRQNPSIELAVLCLGAMFMAMVFAMFGPAVPLMATDLGASPGMLGAITGASIIVTIPLAIPVGGFVRRHGTRGPAWSGAIGAGISCALVYVFPTLLGLFLGLVLHHLCRLLMVVATQTHASRIRLGPDSTRSFVWFAAASDIGHLGGPLISGLIIDAHGATAAWIWMAGLLFLSGAILLALPQRESSIALPGARFDSWCRLRSIVSTKMLVGVSVAFAVITANALRNMLLPVWLTERDYTATTIGALLSIRSLVGVVSRIGLARLLRIARGNSNVMLGGMLLLAIALGITPLCRSTAALAIDSAAVGVAVGLVLPLSLSTVADSVSYRDRGLAIGTRITANRAAQMLGPMAFGGLAQIAGIPAAFWTGGMFLGAAVAVLLVVRTRLAKTKSPAQNKS